jgi:hypothetical protein
VSRASARATAREVQRADLAVRCGVADRGERAQLAAQPARHQQALADAREHGREQRRVSRIPRIPVWSNSGPIHGRCPSSSQHGRQHEEPEDAQHARS